MFDYVTQKTITSRCGSFKKRLGGQRRPQGRTEALRILERKGTDKSSFFFFTVNILFFLIF